MMETKNDETKSCVFYGFLNICSVDWNDTFVKLLDQCLSKIKDSSAKRQDGLQLNLESVQSKLYSYNGCYLHYTIFIFIPHSKILEAKSNYPKVCQCRKTSGQTKAMNTATFQLQRKLLALWGNVFFETTSSKFIKMEKVYSVQNCRPRWREQEVSKTSYCRYVLLYQWRWKFKLTFIWSSKFGFREIDEKLVWYIDPMLKFVTKLEPLKPWN